MENILKKCISVLIVRHDDDDDDDDFFKKIPHIY